MSALTIAYQQLHNYVFAELESQTDLASLFGDLQSGFNSGSGTYYWNFLAAETEILSDLSSNRVNALNTLTDFNNALHVFGLDSGQGYATFRTDLATQGADVSATFTGGADQVYGTVGNDTIDAWSSNQVITADQGGNDTLVAGGSNQTFWGSGGSNVFIGGTGGGETFFAGNNANPATGGVAGSRDTFIAGQGTEIFREGGDGNATAYYTAGDGDISVLNLAI